MACTGPVLLYFCTNICVCSIFLVFTVFYRGASRRRNLSSKLLYGPILHILLRRNSWYPQFLGAKNFNLFDNSSVFYKRLFDVNSLRMMWRRSQHAEVLMNYIWKSTFQYLYICRYYPLKWCFFLLCKEHLELNFSFFCHDIIRYVIYFTP